MRSSGRAMAGRAPAGKARAMAGRLRALRGVRASAPAFDVALSHASHELPLVARSLGIPSSYAFDYEFARVQHGLGCRAARRVDRPGRDSAGSARPAGRARRKVRRYPGLKEEYYLARLRTRSVACSTSSGSTANACSSSCARLRTSRSTTATETRSSPTCSSGSDATKPCTPSSSRGRRSSATRFAHVALPSLVVPGAGDRRAEPRRARRPRRLGRRDDEPRGGRTRRAGLHDVRRTARRGRRRPRERRTAATCSPQPRTSTSRSATARRSRPTRDPALLLDLMLSALEG